MTDYNDGHGASIAFATGGTNAGLAMTIISQTPPTEEGEEIDTSHLGCGTHRTREIGALLSQGGASLSVVFNPAQHPVVGGSDTITITLPLRSGESTAGTIAFTGSVQSYAPGEIASNTRMEGEVSIIVSGDVTVTPGS